MRELVPGENSARGTVHHHVFTSEPARSRRTLPTCNFNQPTIRPECFHKRCFVRLRTRPVPVCAVLKSESSSFSSRNNQTESSPPSVIDCGAFAHCNQPPHSAFSPIPSMASDMIYRRVSHHDLHADSITSGWPPTLVASRSAQPKTTPGSDANLGFARAMANQQIVSAQEELSRASMDSSNPLA